MCLGCEYEEEDVVVGSQEHNPLLQPSKMCGRADRVLRGVESVELVGMRGWNFSQSLPIFPFP